MNKFRGICFWSMANNTDKAFFIKYRKDSM